MIIDNGATTEELVKQIQACANERFTGHLEVEDPQGLNSWSLLFRHGRLTGCVSSIHPIRSWCRQLSVHCPELYMSSLSQRSDRPMYWDYNYLAELVKQGKIRQRQVQAVVADQITEVLFDIQQYSEQLNRTSKLPLTYKQIPTDIIDTADSTLVLISAINLCSGAMQTWEAWCQAGLADYSPNLAPVIQQAMELRQQTSAVAYRNLISLADGHWTLRDLALKLKQNLVSLTQSIMPYIQQGLIGLVEIEDFQKSFQPVMMNNPQAPPGTIPTSTVQPQSTSPLVAYIDDSQNDSLKMNRILTQAGYRFISIQDSMKALLILLEHKPDLIFLDLVMPVANGYEICTQIRRVSVFQDKPVIILTNNDGIVDRVRAKMVGASGFLAKPIEKELVLRTVQRYLAVVHG